MRILIVPVTGSIKRLQVDRTRNPSGCDNSKRAGRRRIGLGGELTDLILETQFSTGNNT